MKKKSKINILNHREVLSAIIRHNLKSIKFIFPNVFIVNCIIVIGKF